MFADVIRYYQHIQASIRADTTALRKEQFLSPQSLVFASPLSRAVATSIVALGLERTPQGMHSGIGAKLPLSVPETDSFQEVVQRLPCEVQQWCQIP